MIELLEEIEDDKYDAVLVMDLDRLGRGNMREQGIILEAFKEHNTKIITPNKVYDLDNEFDEEYSEFEAFMAHKELKIIKKRLHLRTLKTNPDSIRCYKNCGKVKSSYIHLIEERLLKIVLGELEKLKYEFEYRKDITKMILRIMY